MNIATRSSHPEVNGSRPAGHNGRVARTFEPSQNMRALWVGPESDQLEWVRLALQSRWLDTVITVTPEATALKVLRQGEFQLVFVPLTPEANRTTVDLIQGIRECTTMLILGVDEGANLECRVQAFLGGCDNLIPQATEPLELLAIILAALRRARGDENPANRGMLEFGPLTVSLDTMEVRAAGFSLTLTPTEFRLLAALTREQGAVTSQSALLHALWGNDWQGHAGMLRKYVQRLRQKLAQVPGQPCGILTVNGVGCRLVSSQFETVSPDPLPLAAD